MARYIVRRHLPLGECMCLPYSPTAVDSEKYFSRMPRSSRSSEDAGTPADSLHSAHVPSHGWGHDSEVFDL